MPNAANTAAVVAALQERAPAGLTITDEHRSRAVLAVQGPKSAEVLGALGLPTDMDYMGYADAEFRRRRRCGSAAPATPASTATSCCRRGIRRRWCSTHWSTAVAAAGGELGGPRRPRHPAHRDGLSAARPRTVAGHLAAAGALRLGRRLEEGRILGPRRAAGREGGRTAAALRGLRAVGRGVLRARPDGARRRPTPIGVTTSGTFSPTLKVGIALALIDTAADIADGQRVAVDVRGRLIECEVVKPPFVERRKLA